MIQIITNTSFQLQTYDKKNYDVSSYLSYDKKFKKNTKLGGRKIQKQERHEQEEWSFTAEKKEEEGSRDLTVETQKKCRIGQSFVRFLLF